MKRKEIIERFKIKDSFLNLMITRATVLKKLKAGMGYANEYDDKDVCLILIGWELHKMGISFRFIDRLLFVWQERFFKDFKKNLWSKNQPAYHQTSIMNVEVKNEHEFICITSDKCNPKVKSKQLLDLAWESCMSKKDVMRLIEQSVEPAGMVLIDVKKIVEKMC
jgi:hypothetical protein